MPDNAVEPSSGGDYPADMATRLAILETIAERSDRTQQAVLGELRDLRTAIETQGRDLRTAIELQGRELWTAIEMQGRDLRTAIETQGRDLRTAIETQGRDLRTTIETQGQAGRTGPELQQRIHDRDFRLTFAAIITTAVGLAWLIAHVGHWL